MVPKETTDHNATQQKSFVHKRLLAYCYCNIDTILYYKFSILLKIEYFSGAYWEFTGFSSIHEACFSNFLKSASIAKYCTWLSGARPLFKLKCYSAMHMNAFKGDLNFVVHVVICNDKCAQPNKDG